MIMNNEAWNKVTQTHDLFKKIIAPLKQHLGLSFGYMKFFLKENYYYRVMENLECNRNLISNLVKGRIFSDRNVTNYFDGDYRYTLWPKLPKHLAMEICYNSGVWNGITVSKVSKNYVDIYWFNAETQEKDWNKFFVRNKLLLLEFINYFNQYKKFLSIDDSIKERELFRFSGGFDIIIPDSEYLQNELPVFNDFLKLLRTSSPVFKNLKLSRRETEVLSLMCQGYTAKLISQKFNISSRTVECYVERIKNKTGLLYKTELIKFGEVYFNKIL